MHNEACFFNYRRQILEYILLYYNLTHLFYFNIISFTKTLVVYFLFSKEFIIKIFDIVIFDFYVISRFVSDIFFYYDMHTEFLNK